MLQLKNFYIFYFSVNSKFLENGRGLTIEEAKAIRAELLSIQQSLSTGEQEKVELMKSLACLKDDLTRLQQSESSLDVSVINAHEKFSTASQTDLSGEVGRGFSIKLVSIFYSSSKNIYIWLNVKLHIFASMHSLIT